MRLIRRAEALPGARRIVLPDEVRGVSDSGGGGFSILGAATGGGAKANGRWDADSAIREAYYSNVFVYACAQAIAKDVSGRVFKVGADPSNPADFDPNHPLARRLSTLSVGGPNPTTPASRLWKWSIVQRLITGAFAWEIVPADLTFWPLLTRCLTPIPTDGRRASAGYFAAFDYAPEGTEKVRLSRDRVFYDWEPSQDDWRKPESALQAARLDVSVAVMQDRYDHAFLQNDARPAAIIVHEAFVDEVEKRKWRRSFLSQHRGPDNAGRVHFAEAAPQSSPKDSLFIQTLGLSQKDAEFIRRYEAKLRAITVAFGVPMSRLGDASERTYSNADREALNYWPDTVQTLGDTLAESVNLSLMPLFDSSGNVGFFDWSDVPELEPVKKYAVGDVPVLKKAGIISVNEGRDVIGLEPVPGQDELAAEPTNPAPIGLSAEGLVTLPEDMRAPITPEDVSVALRPVQQAIRALQARVESLALPTAAADDAPTVDAAEHRRAARRAYAARADRRSRRMEAAFRTRFQDILDAQLESVIVRLEGKRGRQAMARDAAGDAADAIFDRAYWEKYTADQVRDLYAGIAAQAFDAFDAAFDISFDLDAPFAQKYILGRANMLAGNVTATTYDGIKQALADGAKEGEGIPELADRIRGLFAQTYASRAETVARTETISAYNGSTAEAAAQAPDVIGGLEWIATNDDRTRDDHAEADGQIIQIGDTFDVGGEALEYPGDPSGDPENIVNCRCATAPVVLDDMPEGRAVNEAKAIIRAEAERLLIEYARSGDLTGALRGLTNP